MKVRRVSTIIVAVTTLAAVGTPAGASHDWGLKQSQKAGGPHEDAPLGLQVVEPEGACAVSGQIAINNSSGTGGVHPFMANHNHYLFVSTTVECASLNPWLNGSFFLVADGGSDGPCLEPVPETNLTGDTSIGGHGECSIGGWSHSDGYGDGSAADGGPNPFCDDKKADGNKGDVTAVQAATGNELNGWVKFIRVGLALHVWGCFESLSVGERYFSGAFDLVPGQSGPTGKVTSAEMSGIAVVGDKLASL